MNPNQFHILARSIVVIAGLYNATAFAGSVDVPNTFAAGTPARASEVNANFTAIESAINGNATDINQNAVAIGANTANINSNSAEIAALLAKVAANVQDGAGTEIGILLDLMDDKVGARVLTAQNYVLDKVHFASGSVHSDFASSLLFESTDCTGTAYSSNAINGFASSHYTPTGVKALYFSNRSSTAIPPQSFGSRTEASGCLSGVVTTISPAFPVEPNNPSITGIAAESFVVPITIQR